LIIRGKISLLAVTYPS